MNGLVRQRINERFLLIAISVVILGEHVVYITVPLSHLNENHEFG